MDLGSLRKHFRPTFHSEQINLMSARSIKYRVAKSQAISEATSNEAESYSVLPFKSYLKTAQEDEERRGALMASRKEEEKLKEVARSQAMKEKKRAAIANAAKQWDELMRQHQELSATPTSVLLQQSRHSNKASRTSGNNSNKLPALDVHPGSSTGSAAGGGAGGMSSRADSARSRTSNLEDRLSDSMGTMNEGRGSQKHSVGTFTGSSGVPSSGGECDISSYHLADLDGETLNLYGTGAIPALDRNWGVQAASHVTTISFRFIDFDQISPHFPKMRARFPNIHTLIFEETNLKHLNQLNALAQLRKLDHLVVKSNGNPLVTNMRLWKYYALHRLSQFSIRKINDKAVTSEELMEAEKLFGDLVSLVNTSAVTANQQVAGSSSATPRANSADISRGKRNPLTSSDSDLKRVTVHGSVPSRGGFCNPLQFVPEDRKLMMENEAVCAKSVASKVVTGSVRDALSIEHKQRVLDNTWDKLFNQLVASYAAQMLDYRNYVQKHLKEIDIVDI